MYADYFISIRQASESDLVDEFSYEGYFFYNYNDRTLCPDYRTSLIVEKVNTTGTFAVLAWKT